VCSSGIKTIDLAFQMILLGRADICIAGGQESMSNCPFVLPDMRWGAKMGLPNGRVVDAMVYDGLWDAFYNRHMAIHGSEVADEFGFTKLEQDEWAYNSQMNAVKAMAEGKLDDEIFPVEVKQGKKVAVMDKDEGPRPETTLEGLSKLPPVFGHLSTVTGQPGSVTAGNAPGVNDGGDVCLLMSREKADELRLKPLFTIVDYAEVSQPTKDIATVAGLAIKKILEQNDMTLNQMDVIEINEAFAAVALVSCRSILGMSNEDMYKKVNVNGGAIAYGHPIGATGARIAMTLGYELKRRGGGWGVCGICSGHAQGDAMLIRVEK
jgi:acetyl-CoA C-acetyltransferase